MKESIEIKKDNEDDLLSDIKKFIETKKEIPHSFINIMDNKRLFDLIVKLFGNENFDLTENIYSDIYFESLLFFYQNNNIFNYHISEIRATSHPIFHILFPLIILKKF